MKSVLEQSAQMLFLRGVFAIIIALLLLFVPGVTLASGALSFVMLFAAYALVDGIATIYGSMKEREGHWVLMSLVGVVSVIAGIFALANPVVAGLTVLTLMVYLVAFKSILGGALEIVSAIRLREEIDNEWLLALSGFISLVFGLILLTRTIETLATLLLLLPFYLIVSGAMQIGLGFKVRGWNKSLAKA